MLFAGTKKTKKHFKDMAFDQTVLSSTLQPQYSPALMRGQH